MTCTHFLFVFGFLGIFCNGLKKSFTFKKIVVEFFSLQSSQHTYSCRVFLCNLIAFMLIFSLQKYTIHSHAQASFYCDRIYERKHTELKKPFLFVSDFWVFAADRTTDLLSKCYCGVLFLQSHSRFIVAEFFSAIS